MRYSTTTALEVWEGAFEKRCLTVFTLFFKSFTENALIESVLVFFDWLFIPYSSYFAGSVKDNFRRESFFPLTGTPLLMILSNRGFYRFW